MGGDAAASMECMSVEDTSLSLWSAPVAAHPLHATVAVPGSKSLSNRYLVLAALGKRPVTLRGLLRSRDTELMMDALRALGVRCQVDASCETTVVVTPPADGVLRGNVAVYCGLAGTVMRFVPALALYANGAVRFDGDRQAYARPMEPLLDGLRQLGAQVIYHGTPGFLPFTVVPPSPEHMHALAERHAGGEPVAVSMDASMSSQFISGMLLAASRLPFALRVCHTGAQVPSMPHIRMTVADIAAAGGSVAVDDTAMSWTVAPAALQLPERVDVEPDLSNAAPFLGAALLAGGTVSVPYWPEHTTQPGGLLPNLLADMGADVSFPTRDGVRYCQVRGNGVIHGLGTCDLRAAGELAPSLAALLAVADAPTSITGIAHLRGHETDRLAALVTEIRRVGGEAEELADGIALAGTPVSRLRGATMDTYADHRMATFAAMLGLVVPDIVVRDVQTTRKTLPDFVDMWSAMLAS